MGQFDGSKPGAEHTGTGEIKLSGGGWAKLWVANETWVESGQRKAWGAERVVRQIQVRF